jgi:hypothetical protein
MPTAPKYAEARGSPPRRHAREFADEEERRFSIRDQLAQCFSAPFITRLGQVHFNRLRFRFAFQRLADRQHVLVLGLSLLHIHRNDQSRLFHKLDWRKPGIDQGVGR